MICREGGSQSFSPQWFWRKGMFLGPYEPYIRAKPLKYDERACQVLPQDENWLQLFLDDAEKFTINNEMKINPNRTKISKFDKSRKDDFPPEVCLSNNQLLVLGLRLEFDNRKIHKSKK